MLRKLFSWTRGRECPEAFELRREWAQAAEPTAATDLPFLELREERKAEARSALVQHREQCRICRGELRGTPPDHHGASPDGEFDLDPSADSAFEHTREAA